MQYKYSDVSGKLAMTTEIKHKMIKKGRIILNSPLDYLFNYAISITFGAFGLTVLLLGWKFEQSQSSPGQMTNRETLVFGFIWLFTLAMYLIQRGGLKLEKETLDLEKDEIYKVLNEVGQKLDWTIITATEDIIIADSVRLFKADNRITILVDGKDIYINARSRGPEFSFFRQGKLADDFRSVLRMRYFEIQHQKRLSLQASR